MKPKIGLQVLALTLLVTGGSWRVASAPVGTRLMGYALSPDDRTRLAEANRLRNAIEDRAWPSWRTAPFALLLVTDSVEFLFWHARPSAEFVAQGYDSVLHTEVFARPRRFPPKALATFPAFDQTPTIVVGEPGNTRKNSTEWVLTVLHEHFHQLQFARPDYYRTVDSLGLSRGDQTGGWMLNYPFSYDSVPIQRLVSTASAALAHALRDSSPSPKNVLRRFFAAYETLRAVLSPNDRRYLDFQVWQEGVARYIEYECALLAQSDAPSAAFAALPDYAPYGAVAPRLRAEITEELRASDLKANRRTSFYPVGAGVALLLDRAAPGWKERYFSPMFTLEPQVQAVLAQAP